MEIWGQKLPNLNLLRKKTIPKFNFEAKIYGKSNGDILIVLKLCLDSRVIEVIEALIGAKNR